MLRTSAVKVINPTTGESTLAHAQHDTASQATLISEKLREELNLDVKPDKVIIHTLAEQTTKCGGLTEFNLQSLCDNKIHPIKNALVVPDFVEEDGFLPHMVNVSHLEHFKGVDIPTVPHRNKIDILMGQSDKALLAVVEERESLKPDELNFVLTRLGPIASGGKAERRPEGLIARKALTKIDSPCECGQLKLEISNLKEALRDFEREDEVIQPSKNEVLASRMVASDVKVVDGRY